MLFKNITILDEEFNPKENMYVGIKDEIIAYIGKTAPTEDYGEVYDGTGKLLLPCFYNEHSHLPMVYMRGYGENLPLMQWLQGRIFPFEAKLNEEDMYNSCLLGVAEMLRYGIGATQEMYLNYSALGRALTESGVKACFSNTVVWMGTESYYDLPYYKEALETIKKYNTGECDRVRAEMSLHAEYTSTEKVARSVAEFAQNNDLTMQVHVSETAGEVDICRKRHKGKSPVEYLHDCGIFSVPTVAAHCVHVTDEDIAILKEDNVTVATCPKSNAKLGSGICPVSKLIKAGVNVAVGTDSVASNNNLNMIEEMRFFSYLQKATELDPVVITPKETIFAATRAGAIAQKRMDSGLIKKGFKADLTVMELDRIYMKPCYDILNNLIFSSSGNDVVLTMVDGKVLYKDGEYTTIDVERVMYETEKSRSRILNQIASEAVPDL